MPLPEYVDCKNKEILHCDYLLTTDCPSTCAYAIDIGGLCVGSMVVSPQRTSETGLDTDIIDK